MYSTSISDDLEPISVKAIALTDEQIDQARRQSCALTTPTEQWQAYLNTLALVGFEQWLHQRASDISINSSQHLMVQSSEVFSMVCNLVVNDFKICLIPVESQPDEVELPSDAIASPELAAHFYVTVVIYEEQSQIVVHSFLRYDQITTQLRSLQLDVNHLYSIPIAHFNPDLNRLLLYLRCSQPSAIPLPSPPFIANSQQLTANSYPLTASSINIRRWLQNELDELAQQLSWVLLPPLTLENAMRLTARIVNQPTPQEGFEGVIKQLVRNGMTLPSDARVAYQDLDIGKVTTRLYAIAGTLSNDHSPEWTLLLILGPRSYTPLPRHTQLQISDSNTLLTQQTLAQQDSYLYAKVIGTLDEQFQVTITVPDSDPLTLPPFVFSAISY